jgi:hypothetical protein
VDHPAVGQYRERDRLTGLLLALGQGDLVDVGVDRLFFRAR